MQTTIEINFTTPRFSFKNIAETIAVKINVLDTVKLSTAPAKWKIGVDGGKIHFSEEIQTIQ